MSAKQTGFGLLIILFFVSGLFLFSCSKKEIKSEGIVSKPPTTAEDEAEKAKKRVRIKEQESSEQALREKALKEEEARRLREASDKARGGDLHGHLRGQKPYRKRYASGQDRRGQLKGRVSIDERPVVVDQRSRLGDWEGDTIIGRKHQGALLSLVERKSSLTLIGKLARKSAEQTRDALPVCWGQSRIWFIRSPSTMARSSQYRPL